MRTLLVVHPPSLDQTNSQYRRAAPAVVPAPPIPSPSDSPPSSNPGTWTSRAPHSSRRESLQEACFAFGHSTPRDMHYWSRERADAYNLGFEDALQAVQEGVVGLGGAQCESYRTSTTVVNTHSQQIDAPSVDARSQTANQHESYRRHGLQCLAMPMRLPFHFVGQNIRSDIKCIHLHSATPRHRASNGSHSLRPCQTIRDHTADTSMRVGLRPRLPPNPLDNSSAAIRVAQGGSNATETSRAASASAEEAISSARTRRACGEEVKARSRCFRKVLPAGMAVYRREDMPPMWRRQKKMETMRTTVRKPRRAR